MPTTLEKLNSTPLQLKLLDLDPKNPRLREASVAEDADQITIGEALWKELNADEIVMSIIAADGFFTHEPLMVESAGAGRFTVIEGNRRLLAAKVIADVSYRKSVGASGFEEFKHVAPELIAKLQELPCIVTTREALWQFVGFKHVNGAKPWSAISKAEFIADVHEKRKVSLQDIARQIGDRHDTVQRLYQGWRVLQQAEQTRKFAAENRFSKRFAFSHLYTILEYPNSREFLGLSAKPDYESRNPVPKSRIRELGDLCLWLFGQAKPEPIKPLIKSQNPDLRDLETALGKESGVKALRAGLTLQVARDASLGNKRIFDDALTQALTNLKNANAVCAIGAKGDRGEQDAAQQAVQLAVSILEEIERKMKGGPRRGSVS